MSYYKEDMVVLAHCGKPPEVWRIVKNLPHPVKGNPNNSTMGKNLNTTTAPGHNSTIMLNGDHKRAIIEATLVRRCHAKDCWSKGLSILGEGLYFIREGKDKVLCRVLIGVPAKKASDLWKHKPKTGKDAGPILNASMNKSKLAQQIKGAVNNSKAKSNKKNEEEDEEAGEEEQPQDDAGEEEQGEEEQYEDAENEDDNKVHNSKLSKAGDKSHVQSETLQESTEIEKGVDCFSVCFGKVVITVKKNGEVAEVGTTRKVKLDPQEGDAVPLMLEQSPFFLVYLCPKLYLLGSDLVPRHCLNLSTTIVGSPLVCILPLTQHHCLLVSKESLTICATSGYTLRLLPTTLLNPPRPKEEKHTNIYLTGACVLTTYSEGWDKPLKANEIVGWGPAGTWLWTVSR